MRHVPAQGIGAPVARLLNVLDGVLLVGIGVHGLWRNQALIGAFLG